MSFFKKNKAKTAVSNNQDFIEVEENFDSKFSMEVPENGKHDEDDLPKFIIDPETNESVAVRYDHSFFSRLSQSNLWVKKHYDILKNELLKYRDVHTRVSWKFDSFNIGRTHLARLVVRRNTLTLYLALDPKLYLPKYKGKDSSNVTLYQVVPYAFAIKNNLRVKRALELIKILATTHNLRPLKKEPEFTQYSNEYPYYTNQELLDNNQIKIVKSKAKLKSLEENFLDYDFEKNEHNDIVDDELLEDNEDSLDEGDVYRHTEDGLTYKIRLNKSFSAKMCQTDQWNKQAYQALKNHLLGYERVVSKVSWKHELFSFKRDSLLMIVLRRKTLLVFFALNPSEYIAKFEGKDASEVKTYQNTPYQFAIFNTKRLNNAFELIDVIMSKYNLAKLDQYKPKNYLRKFPNRTTSYLIAHDLIKEVRSAESKEVNKKVNYVRLDNTDVSTAKKMLSDADAVKLLTTENIKRLDKSHQAIVNIDQLSSNFESGDVVNLTKLINKGLVPKNTTYVKVLARGVIDKPLTVIANHFSLDAVKMIHLTSGSATVIK